MGGKRIGVTVGKFNPPHLGHAHLLRDAASRVGHLFVILADHADQTLDAADRAAWLQDAAPANATVLVTPDDIPVANEPWAKRALEILPEPPDVVFTSEPWGPGWAEAMGAAHHMVDEAREHVPVAANRIRADLRGNFRWLVPAAKSALSHRVVIAGAESTGKTTLAEALARRLQTVWVPEYGRSYWEGRRYAADQRWSRNEFRHIAHTQHDLMDDLGRRAEDGVLVADTDALVTAVWHRRYMHADDDALEAIVAAHRPAVYLVAGLDAPWTQDGTRESEAERGAMHEDTLARCHASGVATHVLEGSLEERVDAACAVIDALSFEPLA